MAIIQGENAETFEVEQEITLYNTVDFQKQLEIFLRNSGKNLILDLNKAKYVNNSALSIIVKSAIDAIKENRELVIAGMQPPISEIFELVQFNKFIKLFTTREEAIDYFKSKK